MGEVEGALTRELKSVIVWTLAFLFFELPSKDVWGLWPWYSLSRTVQLGEQWWWPFAIYTAVFMGVLLGHFEFDWSARWVILLGLVGGALAISRLLRWL